MKKNVLSKIITCFAFVLSFFMANIVTSGAWFSSLVSIEPEVPASTHGAYYEGGKGTEGDPYRIASPYHLYNLAWLQYLGKYDSKVTYFKLSDTLKNDTYKWVLDMEPFKTALPPIGTSEHPFIGHFNGNGITIQNLSISNDITDLNRKPYGVDVVDSDHEFKTNEVNIVGFFGVVGKLKSEDSGFTYDNKADAVYNVILDNVSIKTNASTTLAGLAAGYVNGPMSNVTIKNSGNNTSKINISYNRPAAISGFGAISNYSTVGYCEKDYRGTISQTEIDVYDPVRYKITFAIQETGNNNDFGGSIDMLSVFNRLTDIRDRYATAPTAQNPYYYYETNSVVLDSNGEVTSNIRDNSNSRFTRNNVKFYNQTYKENDYKKEWGNLNIYIDSSDLSTIINPRYAMLFGGHYADTAYSQKINQQQTGRRISIGNNCLSINKDEFNDGNSARIVNFDSTSETPTLWTFSNWGSGSSKIYVDYLDGSRYYLLSEEERLSLTTNSNLATTWTIVEEGNRFTIKDSDNLFITYENQWMLMKDEVEMYHISYENNYLGGTTSLTGVNQNNAGSWFIPGLSNDGKTEIYSLAGNLYGNNGTTLSISDNTREWTCCSNTPGKYAFYYTYRGSGIFTRPTYYCFLTYSGSSWQLERKNSNQNPDWTDYLVDVTQVPVDTTVEVSGSTTSDTTQKKWNRSHMDYSGDDATYIPLNVYATTTAEGQQYYPTKHNTGYICGGSMYTGEETGITDDNTTVRIGFYPKQRTENGRTYNLLNNWNSSNGFTDVLTFDSSGKEGHIRKNNNNEYVSYTSSSGNTIQDPTVLTKFENVTTSLHNVISSDIVDSYNGDDNVPVVHGLHFMPSPLSVNDLANASYASINGVAYTGGYQLPASSIDFNLKDKGTITFMAGTYFPGNDTEVPNNSFFTLYEIIRNETTPNENDVVTAASKITAIRRISDILYNGPTHSYVYHYEEGGWSAPYTLTTKGEREYSGGNNKNTVLNTCPTGYTSIFELSRIDSVRETNITKKSFKPGNSTEGTNKIRGFNAYYFEIPLNDGEYALGSVPGGTGAYLMYLDIGANAKPVNRTVIVEKWKTTTDNFTYPLGVAFTVNSTDPGVKTNTITPEDSMCISINAGCYGEIVFERPDDDETTLDVDEESTAKVTTKQNVLNYIQAGFVKTGVTLQGIYNGASQTLEPTPIGTTTSTTIRQTYIDYNVTAGTTDTIVITKVDNNTPTVTRTSEDEEGNITTDTTPLDSDEATIKVYSDTGVRVTSANSIALHDPSTNLLINFSYTILPGNTITPELSFSGVSNAGESSDDTKTTGRFFTINGYTINLTHSSNAVSIHVDYNTSAWTMTITVNGNTITKETVISSNPPSTP